MGKLGKKQRERAANAANARDDEARLLGYVDHVDRVRHDITLRRVGTESHVMQQDARDKIIRAFGGCFGD